VNLIYAAAAASAARRPEPPLLPAGGGSAAGAVVRFAAARPDGRAHRRGHLCVRRHRARAGRCASTALPPPEQLRTCSREDLVKVDTTGCTAVHYAAWTGSADCLRLLDELGARATLVAKNECGETPVLHAIRGAHFSCLRVLHQIMGVTLPAHEAAAAADVEQLRACSREDRIWRGAMRRVLHTRDADKKRWGQLMTRFTDRVHDYVDRNECGQVSRDKKLFAVFRRHPCKPHHLINHNHHQRQPRQDRS
jgi:hypothetical protein